MIGHRPSVFYPTLLALLALLGVQRAWPYASRAGEESSANNAGVTAADATPPGGIATDILDLDGDTFDATVGKGKATLVLFYAPWCGHSRRLMREYAIVASTFHSGAQDGDSSTTPGARNSQLIVARVDTDKYTHFASRFGITGYPTIKFFPAGSTKLQQSSDEAVQEGSRGPTSGERRSGGVGDGENEDPDSPAARIAAAVEHSKRAAALAKARRAEQSGASPMATGLGLRYTGGKDAKSIVSFLNEKLGTSLRVRPARSWVRPLNSRSFEPITMDPDKHVLVFFHAPWCSECSHFLPAWETVAKTFRSDGDKVIVASIDAERHRELAQSQDVTKYPMIKYYPAIEAALRLEAAESKALAAAKAKARKMKSKDEDPADPLLNAFEVNEDGSNSVISLEALQDEEGITSDALDAFLSSEESAEFSVSDLYPRTYNGGMSSQALVDFINEIAKLDRIVGGGIHREAGRDSSLDAKALKFMVALRSGSGDEAAVVHTDTIKLIRKVCGNDNETDKRRRGTKWCVNSQLYTDVMSRVLRPEAGIMWVAKELRRIDAIISDAANVNHAQQTRLLLRRNVLEAFTGR